MQTVSYYEIFRGVIRNDSFSNMPRTVECMETFRNMYVHESWRNTKRFVECIETKSITHSLLRIPEYAFHESRFFWHLCMDKDLIVCT